MNSYQEFDGYLSDKKAIQLTLVDAFFSVANYVKFQHPFVDMLYEKYRLNNPNFPGWYTLRN